MHSIIVGTAGHIDHGKTALVKALTGVDADRLPEEKRRGITIDLGFAELDLGDARVGFVDAPGHERFVKNMLAGAHGLDAVALVIAADEGVMPQTREHFDIVRLLNIPSGVIVITKADMVDEELLTLVRAEAEELVADSFLENAPVIATSARTGAGLDELKGILRAIARNAPARSAQTVARLPIDRAFSIRGFGAVVTGTLVAGEIAAGDEMELLPAKVRVRVRGAQVHGRAVEGALAGQRAAINLAGVEAAGIERGMTLAPAGRLQPTQMIDARVEVLSGAPRPLRSRARVRLHAGAAEVLARVAVLEETGEIASGARGLAQFRLESPVTVLPGERFIIRSYSPQRTIAGGLAIDAHAIKHRGRDRAEARARLLSLEDADSEAARLALVVDAAGEVGLRRGDLAARTGWNDATLNRALAEAKRNEGLVEAEGVFTTRASLEGLTGKAVAEVEAFHRRESLARGMARETLRERVFAHLSPELFRAALDAAEEKGALRSDRDVVLSATRSGELAPPDAATRDRLAKIYEQAALEAPTVDEALSLAGVAPKDRARGRKLLQLLIDAGTLVRVRDDLFTHRDALAGLITALRDYAAQHEPSRAIDMAAFKELAGVSRKYAIPLLEYLDRERITRRDGDRRVIL